jgi:hypothetical protein
MTIPKVKYQIVVTQANGTQIVMYNYLDLDQAMTKFVATRLILESGAENLIPKDPHWSRIELQRIEIVEGLDLKYP